MKDAKALMGYVRALLEIADETKQATEYLSELQSANEIISRELISLSENPAFSEKERRLVIQELAKPRKLSHEVTALLVLMAQNRRLRRLPEITKLYQQELDKREQRARLIIRSAKPLSATDQAKVLAPFQKQYGKHLVTEVEVDPTLIAGVQVQVGSKIFDGSVRGRLQELRTQLER